MPGDGAVFELLFCVVGMMSSLSDHEAFRNLFLLHSLRRVLIRSEFEFSVSQRPSAVPSDAENESKTVAVNSGRSCRTRAIADRSPTKWEFGIS